MKKVLALILALCMVFALAACGETPSTNNGGDTTNPANAGNNTNTGDSTNTGSGTQQQETAGGSEGVDLSNASVTIICPYGAGGGTDVAMRILAQAAEEVVGGTYTVENDTGGSGTTGLYACLTAAHDGYTLATASVDLITLSLLGIADDLTLDTFAPICIINGEPAGIIVPADSQFDTIDDFIQYGVDNPGAIKLANAGAGNIWHLAAIGIELKTGASFNHIPYSDGTSASLPAVLSGDVDAVVCSPAEAASYIDAGQLKVLAVANTERLEAYPDVPTLSEKGIDLVIAALRGLCVPADCPPEMIAAMQENFEKVINSDTCRKLTEDANMTYMPLNAEETDSLLRGMQANYEEIISAYLASAA